MENLPMNLLRLLVAALASWSLAGSASADDTAKLIVGSWEVVKGDKSTVQVGSTYDFDKDGGVMMNLKFGVKGRTFPATYMLEGDQLLTTVKGTTGARTVTIKKITDKELIWKSGAGRRWS